jgi:hypothetical protein
MEPPMAYLIGADEAGYGPNLGPLVISVTVWRAPDLAGEADLYDLLRQVVGKTKAGDAVPIADSKLLYQPGNGLAGLELGLYAALAAWGKFPRTWRGVWETLLCDGTDCLADSPWFSDYDAVAPVDLEIDRLEQACGRFREALAAAGVECLLVRSAAIFPKRFNELAALYGSKGELLSRVTLSLVRECMAMASLAASGRDSAECIYINCDKHGGRNRYAGLLQHLFDDELIEVARESAAESVYRWGLPRRRVQIRFTAKGESWLPSALASMASKYLRELAMRPFNEFWRRHLPELKATAGYPLDARRFKNDIQQTQERLRISDEILWRTR